MVGKSLGHYEILALLGAGGMGEVYLAEDSRLNRRVALKVLPSDMASDPLRRERFEREAKAVAALNHPNIVVLYTVEDVADVHFITMELVEGGTLLEAIPKGGLPIEKFLDLSVQLAEAIKVAHEHGIVHRDLKPTNIMLSEDGRVKVLDFGLAKLKFDPADVEDASEMPTAYVTEEGNVIGTVAYMSPEQLRGLEVDPRSDIFSLGVVLYEMATGDHPFKRESRMDTSNAILNEPTPVAQLSNAAPKGVALTIEKMLTKDLKGRHQSIGDVARELQECRAQLSSPASLGGQISVLGQMMRRPAVAIPSALVLIAGAFFGYRALEQASQVRWAREEALPEISQLVEEDRYRAAYALAVQAERYIPGDTILSEFLSEVSLTSSFATEPAGADVYYRAYDAVDEPWTHLGQSPVDNFRITKGIYRWRVEKDGYETVEFARASRATMPAQLNVALHEEGTYQTRTVEIPARRLSLELAGFNYQEYFDTPAYFVDKYEVTNQEFKEFVDGGGYENRDYWKHEFMGDGGSIPWEQAMERFEDTTGRRGPSTWAGGSYSPGHEEYPVTGVSWYEAAAYAEFRGKSLPTLYHWLGAAQVRHADWVAPRGNFLSGGPVPVGSRESVSPTGTHDMAGNVKEWCWNLSETEDRYIVGGAWIDDTYMFTYPEVRPPLDRSEVNGFRTVTYAAGDPEETLFRSIPLPNRNYVAPNPVDDEVFQLYAQQYDYDDTGLNDVVEATDAESFEHWTRERITFDAAYGDERMIAYLYLPKNADPPYQTVLYFPGTGTIRQSSSENIGPGFRGDFILMSGRAFVYPIYKSTYERQDGLMETWPDATVSFTEHAIMWVKDARRTIDYLLTREEIDAAKLGFYGFSWGGRMGPLVLAIEDRLRLGILESGALSLRDARPEAHQAHFAPRVTVPILMLNGEWDFLEPVNTAQNPLFELFGTPQANKKHQVFDAGHSPLPRNQVIQATLEWLDKYLGPVR